VARREEDGGGARWVARRRVSDTRWRGSEVSVAVGHTARGVI
jgi:hypothetical protein